MFYDRFLNLCKQIGKKPSAVAAELGINKSNVSNWKNNGYTPRVEVLQRIADYFSISVDELLSVCDDMPVDISSDGDEASPITLTDHEVELVKSYRAHPEMQPAVDTLLGLSSNPAQKKQA